MAKPRGRQGAADASQHATSSDPTADETGRHGDRPPQRAVGANPQHIIQRRVTFVRACLIAGYTTPEIRRKVSTAYRKEAGARRQHAEAVNVTDASAIAELPVLVWGEPGDEPPSDRTIDRYIAKAKVMLEDDGRAAARLGDRLFGIQLARLNQSYRVAKQKRAPSAMVRVVEATNDLFAFDGAIRPSLTALTAGGDSPRTGDKEPPPEATLTAESALAEMAALLDVARQRQRQQHGGAASATTATPADHPDREPDA